MILGVCSIVVGLGALFAGLKAAGRKGEGRKWAVFSILAALLLNVGVVLIVQSWR
jgi:hypothetical protein